MRKRDGNPSFIDTAFRCFARPFFSTASCHVQENPCFFLLKLLRCQHKRLRFGDFCLFYLKSDGYPKQRYELWLFSTKLSLFYLQAFFATCKNKSPHVRLACVTLSEERLLRYIAFRTFLRSQSARDSVDRSWTDLIPPPEAIPGRGGVLPYKGLMGT